MLTLPDRFEFMSDAWLDEARAWFGKRRDGLACGPFSISERFEGAPPHLKLPGDVADWTIRYDGEALEIARGFDPNADATCAGRYQPALMAAQWVGIQVPGATQAVLREIKAVFGKDAIRFGGSGGVSPAVIEVMGHFHDHMARRTVENPDLEHRARELGMSGKIREMEENGYTVLEGVISPGFADEVRAATLRAIMPLQSTGLNWMLYHGHEFERIIQNAPLMTLIDASLGRGAVIASFSSIKRGPGKGTIPIHTDYAHVPEPYPDFAMTGVGVWALEDWTVASGPTWIIPGSHRMRRGPRPGEELPNNLPPAVPIEMPKGSVVFFTHGVWHWQGDRTDPGDRVTLHAHFNRGILRSLEPKRTDVQILHRNAPRLGEMLGEDDWFEKISAQGRDYGRLAYMNKLHAFTEQKKQAILAGA